MKDALGAVQSVLLLGGTSEIGVAIAEKLAAPRHATVVLAARDAGNLDREVALLTNAGAGKVETLRFDALQTAAHDDVITDAVKAAGGDLDVIILAFGVLGNQGDDEAEEGCAGAASVAQINFVGAISASLAAARQLRSQGHGTLIVLSSVAGVRVRQANFIYGSTKAGLDGFAQGLGDSLVGSGASVMIVRPGFVRTKMTAGMKDAPMATTADAVAEAVVKGLAAGREVVWAPPALKFVFAVMRHLPRALWRRVPG